MLAFRVTLKLKVFIGLIALKLDLFIEFILINTSMFNCILLQKYRQSVTMVYFYESGFI